MSGILQPEENLTSRPHSGNSGALGSPLRSSASPECMAARSRSTQRENPAVFVPLAPSGDMANADTGLLASSPPTEQSVPTLRLAPLT